MNDAPLRVGFVHPDLGIGGAERVVVDAALYLQRAGHKITIFAGHHDPNYCFEATRDGTLDVRACRSMIPTHIAQRLRAVCALLRAPHLAGGLALDGSYDVIFCDLIPHVIPLLRRSTRAKIVYYCHHLDRDPERPPKESPNFFYSLYRQPIDRLEAAGIMRADRILVNSRFTAARFRRAYPGFESPPLEVLYPGVDPVVFEPFGERDLREHKIGCEPGLMLLSINRFVRYKNLGLALVALALARDALPRETFAQVKLVFAGASDVRFRESREVLDELKHGAAQLGLTDRVVFMPSLSDAKRLELLSECFCSIYTPDQEHFGIGPLEAMAAGRPVIAVRSGGPIETVLDGETGFLREPTPQAFAHAIVRLITHPAEADRMGRAGSRRVRERFSLARFGRQLEAVRNEVVGRSAGERREERAAAGR
jgi:alpha-1,3/alpha-1,6-mannosyltransferase